MPRIPGPVETLNYLQTLWQLLPELIEQRNTRIYWQTAAKGLTYLLPYIMSNPNAGEIEYALMEAARNNRLETVQYLLDFVIPNMGTMLTLLDERDRGITTDIFESLLDKMYQSDIRFLTITLFRSQSLARGSPRVLEKIITIARNTLSPTDYQLFLYEMAGLAVYYDNIVAFTSFASADADLQKHNNAILTLAMCKNNTDVVKLLLYPPIYNSKPSWLPINVSNDKAIYIAAEMGKIDVVRVLLDVKADAREGIRGTESENTEYFPDLRKLLENAALEQSHFR